MKRLQIVLILFSMLQLTTSSPVIDVGEGSLKLDQMRDPYMIDLAGSPECSDDVERICGKTLVKTNFDVITCLQSSFKEYEISEKCQNLVWNYKKNVTTDIKYEKAVKQICSSIIQQIPECQSAEASRGHLIACLVEHAADESLQPLPPHCSSFLKRLTPAVFSDYRVIYKFSDACQSDIDHLHCGRVNEPTDHQEAPFHSQGSVLSCLASKVEQLKPKCKFEILRVSELQGNDYHYDRQLFFACRNDREKFCANVQSGEGRVYRCLVQEKTQPEMSEKCRDNLVIRQRLEEEDYKVNFKLSHTCKEDVAKYDCDKDLEVIAGFSSAKMSAVILCLESVIHEGGTVKGECRSELKAVRRSMMEDYRVNPDVVAYCAQPIKDHCGGDMRKDGTTIHCLLDLSRPRVKDNTFKTELSQDCLNALQKLLLEADVVGDYEVDPLLHNTCLSVARVYCANSPENEMYNCLSDSLEKPRMTEECKNSIYQLEYFKNRDIRMDPSLYRDCNEDAKQICHAPPQWHVKGSKIQDIFPVLGCLYRHSWKTSTDPGYKPITKACASQVRRVMRERALSVNLRPEVEMECLTDLSKFCLKKTEKEEEMECLEDHYDDLSDGCLRVMTDYIEEVDKDAEMNQVFLRYCGPVWEKHCMHVVSSLEHMDDERGNDLMECLKENKKSPVMNEQCRTGIEHFQLISLKNIKFSHKLNEACHQDVAKYCHGIDKKDHVLICLSEVRVNDTLLNNKARLSGPCMMELSSELSQRSENIDLDTELKVACEDDFQLFCKHTSHNFAAAHECLVAHMARLNKKCKDVLFKRIQSEAIDPKTDYYLFESCHQMIESHCSEYTDTAESIFSCLYKARNDLHFDDKCKNAVISRSHLFAMDIRLNNELQRSCREDVKKHCAEEMETAEHEGRHEGLVIECLKSIYVHNAGKLEDACEMHIKDLIIISNDDFSLDFSLSKFCRKEIDNNCDHPVDGNFHPLDTKNALYQEDRGRVVNCLKDLVSKKSLTEEGNPKCYKQVHRLIEESLVDVHADVKLFGACTADLIRYCDEVPSGAGKKLECLLVIYNDKRLSSHMRTACKEVLKDRIELWKMAVPAKDLPISLEEVVNMISSSPSSNYLLLLILLLIILIFLMGLCLGRVTKRLRRELKDR